MTTLSLELPESLHRKMLELAHSDGISMHQFAATAIAEKISALTTQSYLEERAKRGSKEKFLQALSKVPNTEPEEFDRL
ncbi:CopG family transcriptional regulator [Methylomagnum ishizawai]|uniref:HicB family protein n=1 Tax=Methylomagnum ishizawai TaxID=1760988 RepID=A0A1Y6D9K7_9GAMM|nr:CopG family transcriptional regulator [Methylomagnum ishizawai]BBL76713.1 hypothetical protein MishRS11D_38110 [Methylomagnum ishizawai]SMF96884.1 hypothetical protein SAMN02949497_4298 [Methylomagnum ishizawai]